MKKKIIVVWIPESEFGYDHAMNVIYSDNPRFVKGSRFALGFLEIASKEGYVVEVFPGSIEKKEKEEEPIRYPLIGRCIFCGKITSNKPKELNPIGKKGTTFVCSSCCERATEDKKVKKEKECSPTFGYREHGRCLSCGEITDKLIPVGERRQNFVCFSCYEHKYF